MGVLKNLQQQQNQQGGGILSQLQQEKNNTVSHGGVPLQASVAQKLNPVQNFGLGLAKGVGSTVLGMGELGTKVAQTFLPKSIEPQGADIYNPETESGASARETLAPSGVAQNLGFFTEKAAEFLAPSSLVTKGQRAITGAVEALPGVGKLANFAKGTLGVAGRAIPEMISAGGVSAVQSGGDAEQIKENAKYAGIASGVLGGIGSAARGVKTALLGDNETRLMIKALRPTGTLANKGAERFKQQLPVAINEVKATGIPVSDLSSLDTAVDTAKKQIWEEVVAKTKAGENTMIDGYKLARSIYSVLDDNSKLLLENPEVKKDVLKMATTYADARMTIPEAQDLLEQTNAFLKRTYQANPGPNEIATLDLVKQMNMKLAESLRKSIDDGLESIGQGAAKELRQRYGALSSLSEAVKSRIPKDERLATMSLGQQFNLPVGIGKIIGGIKTGSPGMALEGATQVAVGQQLKKLNTADELINTIFGGNKPGALSGRVLGNVDTTSPEYKAGQQVVEDIKNTPNKQGGFANFGALNTKSDLLTQAKNAKTFEEFLKGQEKLYHGTTAQFDSFKDTGKLGVYGPGTYFYNIKQYAKSYAQGDGGRIIEAYAPGKFATDKQLSAATEEARRAGFNAGDAYEQAAQILKRNGYIGVKDGEFVTVFDPKNILNKDQLLEIWNNAHSETPIDRIIRRQDEEYWKTQGMEFDANGRLKPITSK